MKEFDCEKCIHHDFCAKFRLSSCSHYKDKSQYIEKPCEAGDTVYVVERSGVIPCVVSCLEYSEDRSCAHWSMYLYAKYMFADGEYFVGKHDLGITVFLTREEAEKALEDCDD